MIEFKTVSIVTAGLIAIGSFIPQKAYAASITAVASGSPNPGIVTSTNLQNGDFTITANNGNPATTTLGDGVDETVRWNFDFSSDPNLNSFLSSGSLTSAVLSLTLSPRSGLITTDSTGIPGVGGIAIPNIPGIPSIGQIGTVEFDLLDFGFNGGSILNALVSGTQNSIAWVYQDDAIISNAQLRLVSEDSVEVPEPTSMLGLFVLGAVGIGSLKCKKSVNFLPSK
ncbi:MAG: PEP-CTERM sorting domain-containing protein [Cyanobacteria bacterium P01_A01_bin.68]